MQESSRGVKQLMVQWLDLGILGPWIILLCLGGAAFLVREEMAKDFESNPKELMLSISHPIEKDSEFLKSLTSLGVEYVQCVSKKTVAEKSFIKKIYLDSNAEVEKIKRVQIIPMHLCPKELESLGSIQLKKMSNGEWGLFTQNEANIKKDSWESDWLKSINIQIEQMKIQEKSIQDGKSGPPEKDNNIEIRIKTSPYLTEERQ